MCQGSAEAPICAASSQTCAQANGGAIVLCLDVCDPLDSACGEGHGCYPVYDSFVCLPVDADAGLQPGDPCADGPGGLSLSEVTACTPETICITADAFTTCEADACCSAVCDLTDPLADDTCAAFDVMQTCQSWFVVGLAPDGFENVGVCAKPP
jgi:hypothetical protein